MSREATLFPGATTSPVPVPIVLFHILTHEVERDVFGVFEGVVRIRLSIKEGYREVAADSISKGAISDEVLNEPVTIVLIDHSILVRVEVHENCIRELLDRAAIPEVLVVWASIKEDLIIGEVGLAVIQHLLIGEYFVLLPIESFSLFVPRLP